MAAGSVAAAAPSGPAKAGGTLTSHRREPGSAGPGEPAGAPPPPDRTRKPREPRWYRRPRWLAVLAAVVVVAAGLGTWAGLNASGSHPGHQMTMPPMSAKPRPKPATSALMNALTLADDSSGAAGKLPPSSCKQDGPAKVICTAPVTGISGAVFQTYPDLKALYAAYTAKVSSLNSGHFQQDFNDCQTEATYGEAGWNHQFQHPKTFTVEQMSMGMVTDDQAAGRVLCNYTQGLEYMVWTQDDGHLMAYVAGPVHGDVWNWWVAVHHNIGFGGAPMNMNM